MKPSIPPSVRIVRSILKPLYRVGKRGYNTTVDGVSTWVLADQFLGGDPAAVIAKWFGIQQHELEDALRWELRSRRWRLARVREAVEAGRVKG